MSMRNVRNEIWAFQDTVAGDGGGSGGGIKYQKHNHVCINCAKKIILITEQALLKPNPSLPPLVSKAVIFLRMNVKRVNRVCSYYRTK